MTAEEYERHREEAEAYMRNCSERQLDNIVKDEFERMQREGEVGEVARIMHNAARREIYRRWES